MNGDSCMKAPSVSVVLPTHNRASLLPRSVHSVLNQSYKDIELIVVNDCSKDSSLEVLAAIQDPRMKVVCLAVNSGPAAARNAGIKASVGRFVAFQDSDAEWLPGKLERQVNLLERSIAENLNTAAVYSRFAVSAKSKRRIVPPDSADVLRGDIYRRVIEENVVDTPALLVRRDLLDTVGFFDETLDYLEDWDLVLRLSQKYSFAFLDEVTLVSYDSPDSVNKRVSPESARKILENYFPSFQESPQAMARVTWAIGSGYANLGKKHEAIQFMKISIGQLPTVKRRIALFAIRFGLNPYPALRKIRPRTK